MVPPSRFRWATAPACATCYRPVAPHGYTNPRCSAPAATGPTPPACHSWHPATADAATPGGGFQNWQTPRPAPTPPRPQRPAAPESIACADSSGLPSSHLLGDAHDRAAGTGIAADFFIGRPHLLGHTAQLALHCIVPHWQVTRQRLALFLALDELLDDAVFQRMKGDNNQTSARRQHIHRLLQHGFQIIQLTVDENADRLKGTGGGMLVLFAERTGGLDPGCQLTGARQRLFNAAFNDRLRDAPGKPLLTVFTQHFGNLVGSGGIQPVGRRNASLIIH